MIIPRPWVDHLADKLPWRELSETLMAVNGEYQDPAVTVYPGRDRVFRALEFFPPRGVRVVILGQDPYHGGQANGLAFSVDRGVDVPPSLRNIMAELHEDVGAPIPSHGDLACWAAQGVLLLNTALTVRAGQPRSHSGLGWRYMVDAIVSGLPHPAVFILWGSHARRRASLLGQRDVVLQSAHPSPLSAYRGFFGSRPFSRANAALRTIGFAPIDWSIL
jgi:uracil-DNA glycosylase